MEEVYYQIEVKRSRRRNSTLEIRPDGTVVVRVPVRATNAYIRNFIKENDEWIREHVKAARKKYEGTEHFEKLTDRELKGLMKEAKKVILPKVEYYAKIVGVSYNNITIRNQKTRWGSCSAKGNLNFNCLLLKTPEKVLEYVVIHELCHRLEMNHSLKFWALVEAVMPDYRVQRKWLRDNGSRIMEMNPKD